MLDDLATLDADRRSKWWGLSYSRYSCSIEVKRRRRRVSLDKFEIESKSKESTADNGSQGVEVVMLV